MKNYLFISKNILVVFALLLCNNSIAQSKNTNNVFLQGIEYRKAVNYSGSAFYFNDWQKGVAVLNNGKQTEKMDIQFDILNGNLVFFHNDLNKLYYADKNTVEAFIINNKNNQLYFEKYRGPEINYKLKKDDFIEIIHKGQYVFFAKYSSIITVATEKQEKDKITPRNYYFIETEPGNIVEIKLRLRKFRKIFPEHKKTIKNIISKNKLRNRSVQDMATLIRIFEQQTQ